MEALADLPRALGDHGVRPVLQHAPHSAHLDAQTAGLDGLQGEGEVHVDGNNSPEGTWTV